MNIYLLSQTENTGYNTYDSCVVIANNEEEAKLIHPANNSHYNNEYYYNYQYLVKYNRFINLKEWTEEDLDKQVEIMTDWYDFETDALDALLSDGGWCKSPEAVTVKYIGEFKGNLDDYPTRIVCASFNAD